MAGATVRIAENSSVVFGKDVLTVNSGGAAVRSSSILMRFYNVDIRPEGTARYAIAEKDGEVAIAALEGSIQITDGRDALLVKPGKAFVAKLGPLPQNDQSDRKRRGGAIVPVTMGLGLSNGTMVALTAMTAALASVLVILTTLKPASACKQNVSPSQPACA